MNKSGTLLISANSPFAFILFAFVCVLLILNRVFKGISRINTKFCFLFVVYFFLLLLPFVHIILVSIESEFDSKLNI